MSILAPASQPCARYNTRTLMRNNLALVTRAFSAHHHLPPRRSINTNVSAPRSSRLRRSIGTSSAPSAPHSSRLRRSTASAPSAPRSSRLRHSNSSAPSAPMPLRSSRLRRSTLLRCRPARPRCTQQSLVHTQCNV